MKNIIKKAKRYLARGGMLVALTCISFYSWAQSNNAASALSTASNEVKKIFTNACTLMQYAGAIAGLVGAFIVYQKWQQGDPQTTKYAAGWFGSCIFLLLAGTILKAMYGV